MSSHPAAQGLSHGLSVLTAANSVVTGTMTEQQFATHIVAVCDEFPTAEAAAAHIAMAAVALLRRTGGQDAEHALTAAGSAIVTYLNC